MIEIGIDIDTIEGLKTLKNKAVLKLKGGLKMIVLDVLDSDNEYTLNFLISDREYKRFYL